MDSIKLLPSLYDKLNEDACWCASFNLIWNDFQNNFLQNDFVCNELNDIISNLIKASEDPLKIDEEDYLIKVGTAILPFKKEIEKAIRKKFKEKSDVLDSIKWSDSNISDILVFYAMIKFTVKFKDTYQIFKNQTFARTKKEINYFGFEDRKKFKNHTPLFYESEKEFAIKLQTKDNKTLYFYRTDNNDNFKDTFNRIFEKQKEFYEYDLFASSLKIPYLNIDLKQNFQELEGIKFTRNVDNFEFQVGTALQTLRFELNNKGAKVKSEALMTMKCMALYKPPERKCLLKDYVFDDTFYLFITNDNFSTQPIVAMRVHNIENFLK